MTSQKKKITKIVKKVERITADGFDFKFLKEANRGGKHLTFHSAWGSEKDSNDKKKELEVNGEKAEIVPHRGKRIWAIYKVG